MRRHRLAIAACVAAFSIAIPATAQRLAVNPALPFYGQNVTVEMQDLANPVFMPASRFVRTGSAITVEYEYMRDGFGPIRPDFGGSNLSLGELAPGNYTVQARLHDIARPEAPPTVVSATIAVVPPQEWGVYSVPVEPKAFAPTQALIRSAAYFDPASMRASVSGNVIRIDFVYRGDAPVAGEPPPGMTSFASIPLPPLAPGSYRLEGWGRDASAATYERYFSKDLAVASAAPVVEFYSAALDHYVMSAGAEEIALLDRGAQGDWKRTGHGLLAWLRASDAPPGAVPVCRFYARGPNSHFYTGSRQECEDLKALEQRDRADAAVRGQPFLGWAYETIAFWALLPQSGRCPAGTLPVYRAYNNRAAQGDSNHRFMTDMGQRTAMSLTWADEGVHLCTAQ